MIWFTQAQPIDVVAYIALAATFSLGLVATMLATAQLWVALRVNARIGKLERRVSDNEEIAQLAERRVDLTVKALHALQRYLTAVDYELDAPILSDAQQGNRI